MPAIEPHFDAQELLSQVHEQEHGLRVTTNNAGGFRRILYTQMRKTPLLRCEIISDPRSATRLFLLRKQPQQLLESSADGQ